MRTQLTCNSKLHAEMGSRGLAAGHCIIYISNAEGLRCSSELLRLGVLDLHPRITNIDVCIITCICMHCARTHTHIPQSLKI